MGRKKSKQVLIPEDLHKELKHKAFDEGTTLKDFITKKLREECEIKKPQFKW